jgi:hypothetical protein
MGFTADRKIIIMAKELLRQRLEIAIPRDSTPIATHDEAIIDALFVLFQHTTKHTIADVLAKHGSAVMMLMASPYAQHKED